MLLLRSLNLSYDGVVLLVVADLMYRYEGRHQEYILLVVMIALYLIANYNIALFQAKIISFEAYVSSSNYFGVEKCFLLNQHSIFCFLLGNGYKK